MPTLRSSRFLRAPENAETISAAPPTSATTMKPTNAGVIPNVSAACCTDSTNISLTSATSTVTTASVARAMPIGHGVSWSPPCSAAANNSRWVLSENTMPSAYAQMSKPDSPRLNCCVNAADSPSASLTADGINNAIVARNSRLA